jgi:hypothetical protein
MHPTEVIVVYVVCTIAKFDSSFKGRVEKNPQTSRSVEDSPYLLANSTSASPEISCTLWKPKVYHSSHSSPVLVSIPSHVYQSEKYSILNGLLTTLSLMLSLPSSFYLQVSLQNTCLPFSSSPYHKKTYLVPDLNTLYPAHNQPHQRFKT